MMSFVQKDVQTFPPNQFGIKRLDEVFFRTQFYRLSELGEMKRVRHDDDANARESLAHFLEHSHSTEHRHLELDQHADKWSGFTLFGDTGETRDAIALRRHFEAECAQPITECPSNTIIIIDHQNSSVQGRLVHYRRCLLCRN